MMDYRQTMHPNWQAPLGRRGFEGQTVAKVEKDMENNNLVRWSKIRDQGKGKYLIFHWLICAVIPAAIIMTVIRGLIIGEGLQYFLSGRFIRNILLVLILCIVIALILGNRKWKKNEKKYLDQL